jgi:hypothetical protein
LAAAATGKAGDQAALVLALDVRTVLSESGFVKGAEFERRVRKLARRSHGRFYFGEEFTTLKDRNKEIGRDLLAKMCRT